MQVVAGSLFGQPKLLRWWAVMVGLLISAIYCVFHLLYQVWLC